MTFEMERQTCKCAEIRWDKHVCPYKEYIGIGEESYACDCCPYCTTICYEHIFSLSGEDKERLR